MKKVVGWIKSTYGKASVFLCLMMTAVVCRADDGGIIPIASQDQTATGTDFLGTVLKIFQQDLLPVLEIGGGAFILYYAITGLWKGFKEYHHTKEMDALKGAVISAAVMIVVGGAILYLLDKIRTYKFT